MEREDKSKKINEMLGPPCGDGGHTCPCVSETGDRVRDRV
jgi:hypothetical protein